MKTLLTLVLLSFALMTTGAFAAGEKPLKGEKLVVIIKTGDVTEAGMGLALAHSAVKKGAKVTVVLGANGALYPAVKGGQQIFAAKKKTPKEMLTAIMADGGAVYICKTCAVFHGLEKKDFISGIQIAPSLQIFNAMFEDGARVMSY